MILSHSHRFIFLKTRKTAGTSFEIALSKYVTPDDVVTPIAPDDEAIRSSLGHAGPQNYRAETDAVSFFNHIEARDVRALIPAATFDSYVKVAIVRNPFDFAVSWYFWERARRAPTSREDFRMWLMFHHDRRAEFEAAYRQRRSPNPGLFASNRLITHIDGKSVVDMMLRYECFESDIASFAGKVGLPLSLHREFTEISAKGRYRPATATSLAMFEGFPQGQEIIKKMFAEEIETYHYGLMNSSSRAS